MFSLSSSERVDAAIAKADKIVNPLVVAKDQLVENTVHLVALDDQLQIELDEIMAKRRAIVSQIVTNNIRIEKLEAILG